MRRFQIAPLIGILGLSAGVLAAGGQPAQAQSDPSTQQVIERLTPPLTRGIRVPGADTPDTPAQAPAAAPAQPPRAPSASVIAPPPPPSMPAMPPPVRETTAPAGVAAISLAVFFPTGSWVLTPQAEQALIPLARALNAPQLARFAFRIEGHTDTVGDALSNQRLSERRAQSVRAYLVQRWGVAPERLRAVGLGETQLLDATPDETPNPRNRRVQVLNLGG